MNSKIYITHAHIDAAAFTAANAIGIYMSEPGRRKSEVLAYAVPRGGVPAAYAIMAKYHALYGCMSLVYDVEKADVIIDDLVASGITRERFKTAWPAIPFFSLYDQTVSSPFTGRWLVFPWEQDEGNETSATDIPLRLLQYIGEDPKREGLRDTPLRFLRAWNAYTEGYQQDPADVLKTFEDGAEKVDEMVVVKHIPVYSHCEHHLAPFFGVAHIGYIPDGRVLGLSKFVRLVNIYARRLQVQERLTQQIAHALNEHLKPKGVGVVIECRHMCMESRGVRAASATTSTSCLLGAVKDYAAARAEFMRLVR